MRIYCTKDYKEMSRKAANLILRRSGNYQARLCWSASSNTNRNL